MSTWQLVVVGLVLLFGLLGVLTPGVPGPAIVWSGVLWWALTERSSLAWWALVGATAVLLVDQALMRLLPARRPDESGVPRRTLLAGGLSAIGGFFLVPVIGGPLGFVTGVYAAERVRLGGFAAARMSTRTAMRAVGFGVLVELFGCLLVAGAWTGAVFAG